VFKGILLRDKKCFVQPALVLGVAFAIVAPAHASFIVYSCGANLCRVNPDGSGQRQLTSNGEPGTSAVYGSPSLTRDGHRLAFTYKGHVLIAGTDGSPPHVTLEKVNNAGSVIMRPDGKQVLELEHWTLMGGRSGVQVCTYLATGSGRNCPTGAGSAGWAPDDNLLISTEVGHSSYQAICHVPVVHSEPKACGDVRAAIPSRNLYDPAISPDGSTLAVTATSGSNTAFRGSIALFDYRMGRLKRFLTAGTNDERPIWSPDGSEVVFQRGDSLYVIASDGKSGSERLLVAHGADPTWGGTGPSRNVNSKHQ
jgi:Tol biopolymer transport system component